MNPILSQSTPYRAARHCRWFIHAMLTDESAYAQAAVDIANGHLDTLILPDDNTDCLQQ
jgi:hypothetical protein